MACRISEDRGDDVSILRKMAWRQVDVAIEEIGVEVVDDLLRGPSGRAVHVRGQVRVDEDTNATYSPAVACSEEQFFSGVVGGV
ncbi:unnamed protein product [Heligmosomoides polygyrus]|uniref:GMC_OxRdtase_N domain-containing protein n=1 Tax=Heligmosomoides polygyrus TaxID=6339 RepID=A0A183F640_HELPZ|nr:unnamed protein product [Heligmosomoides polygyrus]